MENIDHWGNEWLWEFIECRSDLFQVCVEEFTGKLILELSLEEWVIFGHVGLGRLVLQAQRKKLRRNYISIILGLIILSKYKN